MIHNFKIKVFLKQFFPTKLIFIVMCRYRYGICYSFYLNRTCNGTYWLRFMLRSKSRSGTTGNTPKSGYKTAKNFFKTREKTCRIAGTYPKHVSLDALLPGSTGSSYKMNALLFVCCCQCEKS
jgi:hypothetical protein